MPTLNNYGYFVSDNSDENNEGPSKQILERELSHVFKPIIQGFLLPVAFFYVLVVVPNFILSDPVTAMAMSIPSIFTAAIALLCHTYLRTREATFRQLEAIGGTVLLLIYVNFCSLLYHDFNALNLIYFLLLFIITVAVAISVRLIVAMCALTLMTTVALAYLMGQEAMSHVLFASIAAGSAAIGIAVLERGVILKAVRARLTTENLRVRAERDADRDILTGLPNRRWFFSRLDEFLDQGKIPSAFYVGIIDLDGFKPVNDLYGHAIGDELLIEVAKRIRSMCPAGDLVARLGGDEFALVVERPISERQLRHFGEAICGSLREPFIVSGIVISISNSIGFAHCPTNGRTVQQMYERADHALYKAKRLARGDIVVFAPEDESELSGVGRFEQALRNADLHEELSVVFQPQHDLRTGKTSGFEALARWNSPILGAVGPNNFIPAAERIGVIGEMTGILLQKALVVAAAWPPSMVLSVNLSALDLMSQRSIDNIARLVKNGAVDPSRIMFEITETALMTDFDRARTSLSILAELGSQIALDDFGSGYSSFAYIHRFPLNRVKTDRSFVLVSQDDKAISCNIFKAISDLCNNLGVECLAEGVETDEELDTVREAGIRFVQGYYFGRPMDASEANAHLAREQVSSARSAA